MSAATTIGSALRVNLRRYARSRGLWFVLLVAPVAARYMIAGEDGRGVQIALNGHLPILSSPVLGVWLGIVVSTLVLPIAFLYLRSNTTRVQPWQLVETAPVPPGYDLFGRFLADAAILLVVLATLGAAGCFLGWLQVVGPWRPLAILAPLALIAGPALIGLAALRAVCEAFPATRRGWGEGLFFVAWLAALIAPLALSRQPSSLAANLADFAGFTRPLMEGAPPGTDDFSIGGAPLKPGRVALDAERGLRAPGYVPARLAWIALAVALVGLGALAYRPHRARARRERQGRVARLLAPGPPPPVIVDAPPAARTRAPFAALVLAEARLIVPARIGWLFVMAGALAGIGGDYRHVGSPAALLFLGFALSAHAGRSEAKRLLSLTAVAPLSPTSRRLAFVAAGTGLALLMAVPAALIGATPAPLLLAIGTGAVGATTAMLLAMPSGASFAPRLVLLVAWYGYAAS